MTLDDIPLERILQAVKTRPRYRARLIRLLILEMARAPDGVALEEARAEFWVRYDFMPKQATMSQQAALLQRDKLVVRAGFGTYMASNVGQSRPCRLTHGPGGPAPASQPVDIFS